jgi:hypothetical protein
MRLPSFLKPIEPTLDPDPFVKGKGALVQRNGLIDVTCRFVFFASKTSQACLDERRTTHGTSSCDAQHRKSIRFREMWDGACPHGSAELFDGGPNFFA